MNEIILIVVGAALGLLVALLLWRTVAAQR